MNKIEKSLLRLPAQYRKRVLPILEKVRRGDLIGLDIKKIKGYADTFRVRVGPYRVIFRQSSTGLLLLCLARKNDTTYN